jgi:Domain of unknown function (DUF5011)
MKKLFILILATGFVISSCNKDHEVVSTVVEVTYPTINVNGSEFIHLPINGTYTELGATLIDDISGAQSQIQPVANDLDVTTQGIYSVTYEAANTNGFRTEVKRKILVLDYTAPVGLDPNFDISGNYLRAATGVIARLIKLDNGLYISDHIGGTSAIAGYIVTPDTTSIDLPAQYTDGELLEGINETFDNSDPAHTTFSYKIIAETFGTSTRTFVKQ